MRVHDYQSGAELEGEPSDALVAASKAEPSGTGIVLACRDQSGTWVTVAPHETAMVRDFRRVYVQE